ncbi:MAG: M23 family metallopeptidase [Bacteroidales bacterium]|nr:M23 family metallopeptidase [Bacteroidales bacterium]
MIRHLIHTLRWFPCCISLCCLQSFAQQSLSSGSFAPPVDGPLLLTSNYGEIRVTHFHSGIDILSESGNRVYSIDEGYISRIGITLNGYGKALYITHPNGYTSVYGHLNAFMPEIEKYVTDQQYHKRKYVVNLYPAKEKFPVRKGQFIALSGNTGYSFGPHLHFEIRDNRGQIPLNVLKFNLPIADNRRPRINCLGVYPLDPESQVADSCVKAILPLKSNAGEKILLPTPIQVWGNIGFGVETYDFLDGRENTCSPLSVSLLVDDYPVFSYELDRISFGKTSYVDSHIDFAEMIQTGRKIQKLYLDPNNKLDIYTLSFNRGICNFTDSLEHHITIQVEDAAGNRTSLHFSVKSEYRNIPKIIIEDSTCVGTFYYDSLNVYETKDVRIVIPNDALYDHIGFRYKMEKAPDTLFSCLHWIHDERTPVHGSYMVSIKPVNLPDAMTSKAIVVMIDKNNRLISQGGDYAKGLVTSRIGSFGRFAVAVDSIPPEIRPASFISKGKYTPNQAISFQITDNLSGIYSYNGFIDGNWALFEYDAKNSLLFYKPDPSRLAQNKEHILELIVTDNKNNVRKFKGHFYF